MMEEEKRFGLGAGKLYIAPASVSEEEAVSPVWYVGPTKGGVTLAYTAKVHEITDCCGRLVRSVRYGEKIRLEGEMVRLYPQGIARILGASEHPGKLEWGGVCPRGKTAQVRAVLVCRLPREAGGGEMRFSMLAGASAGASLSLSGERDSAVRFSLTAETDGAGLSGRMVLV